MKSEFYGQQEGERVLYGAKPHRLWIYQNFVKVIFASLAVVFLFYTIAGAVGIMVGLIRLLGLVLSMGLFILGWWIVSSQLAKNITYLTDRRVIRFVANTPWTTESRTIGWDEVVKVKTYPPNWLWRLVNIGSVVIHARSTVIPAEIQPSQTNQIVTNDDIEIYGLEYYHDLGNYLDKVLYLYKREPLELKTIRPFIPKPRGQRY